MPPLLDISNLQIAFGNGDEKTIAVSNSNFTIDKGKIVAIVGESGSGKSATALSFLQLLPPQANIQGKLLFEQPNGTAVDLLQLPVTGSNDVRGNSIAMIFQEPMTSLNPVFTCGYQVLEAIRQHQKDAKGKAVSRAFAKERTIELFKKVKLPDPEHIIDKYPHELSGGQKQRVMIAMAISCNPSLLIADEPTTALDVTVQQSILALIKELQQQNNMSVLLITHDLGVVADIADKIVVMYKGEIVEQGDAAVVINTPTHPYTKALLACRPAMHAKGERLPVIADFLGENKRAEKEREPIANTPVSAGDIELQVDHLTVHYKQRKQWPGQKPVLFKAVDDVSLTVNKGETIGLVGESGCGKTTLGRAILQLVTPASGRILLKGKDITTLSSPALRDARKDLQIVFQDPYGSLNPRITIGDAILEPLQVHDVLDNNRQRKAFVVSLLEKVNLKGDHFNRYPHQFSGGQRQRICIARALALNPSFLVFDESVSALDVSVQAQVLNLLNDLKAEYGFTSIFISHDLSVIRYISDRILVMQQGKIVEEGPADEVYYHPKQSYTQQLIDAIPGKKLV